MVTNGTNRRRVPQARERAWCNNEDAARGSHGVRAPTRCGTTARRAPPEGSALHFGTFGRKAFRTTAEGRYVRAEWRGAVVGWVR